VNYFFLACAFFAFHLLFAYLVDRIAIEIAFVICSLVSMFLTLPTFGCRGLALRSDRKRASPSALSDPVFVRAVQ